MLILVCLLAAAAAAPATYDQRQEGDSNIQADIRNVVFLVAVPKKLPMSLFDIFTRNNKPNDKESELQDRADVQVMEAFVEPNTPYHVEIGSERSAGVDGRAVEVVIAGHRRIDSDVEQDEYKLLGATEQCGPDRVRDPVTLICKSKPKVNSEEKVDKTEEKKGDAKEEKKEDAKEEKKIGTVVSQPTPEVVPS